MFSDLVHMSVPSSIYLLWLREGLSGIKVVIKSLSAGFSQPVDRLRHITLVGDAMTIIEVSKKNDLVFKMYANIVLFPC